jgi:serine/threonine-protein kinase RsbW
MPVDLEKIVNRLNRIFPAQLQAFEQVRKLIDEFGGMTGLGREDRHKLTLIVEELFTNTVNHGFKGDSDAPVSITLEELGRDVKVIYEDSAPAFDPFRAGRSKDIDATINERRVGGLGVLLTIGLTREADYAFVEGHNRVSLTFSPGRD